MPLDIPELRSEDIEKISRQKARYAYDILQKPLIVDDTSFSIDALNGFPGPYAAYVLQSLGNQGMVISFADERGIRSFSGTIHGTVIDAMRGAGGFGYDPIFEMEGRTLAELSVEEKNRISHRALALAAFREWFVLEGKQTAV